MIVTLLRSGSLGMNNLTFAFWQKIKDRFHKYLGTLGYNFSLKAIAPVFR